MTRRAKIVLGFTAVAVVAAGAIWAGVGRSAANRQRLLGTWAFVSGGNGRGGTTLTFAEDGKVKTTARWDRETYDAEGTYTVNGDTIEMLVADAGHWGEEAWANWARMTERDGRDKPGTKPQSQPPQRGEPTPRRVTIRSLSDTELVIADGKGRKTVYTRK